MSDMILNKGNIRQWMTEQEPFNGVGFCKRDGEDFAVIDGWETIDKYLYSLVEALSPEALEEYRNFHDPINEHKLVQGNRLVTYGSLAYAGCAVPEVLEIALTKAGLDESIWFEDLFLPYGFSDEYERCCECYDVPLHFVSTSPDTYYQTEHGKVCTTCFKEKGYDEYYLKEAINNPNFAVQFKLLPQKELIAAGFTLHNQDKYQAGLHQGMTDNPHTILKKIQEHDRHSEVVFTLDNSTPFYAEFSAWVREEVQE